MSNVSHAHSIISYTGKEVALTGQRLATITFRTDKETGIKPESKCVSLPLVSELIEAQLLDNWETAKTVVFKHFQDIQDSIVRAKVIEGASVVTNSDIDLWACLAHAQAEQAGLRLSKESVRYWFAEEMLPLLTVTLGAKLGVVNDSPTASQAKTIQATTAQFSKWFEQLTGKSLLTEQALQQVEKALALFGAEPNSMRDKLLGKIAAIRAESEKAQEVATLL